MAQTLDYQKLYALQDGVLGVVFALNNSFYLTGGTALHRFYYNLRYSDDLDFFCNFDELFSENINEAIDALSGANFKCIKQVISRDFQRWMVNDILQMDFINDRVWRDGKSQIFGKYKIDNELNILTNKITAILDRDEEKDIFDLCAIAVNEDFNWEDILDRADKKANVDRALLIERLKTFPLEWLNNIKQTKSFMIDGAMINQMCCDIFEQSNNNLKMSIK